MYILLLCDHLLMRLDIRGFMERKSERVTNPIESSETSKACLSSAILFFLSSSNQALWKIAHKFHIYN